MKTWTQSYDAMSSAQFGCCFLFKVHMEWVFPKIGVPKMDGLFHGKPYFLMDDLGVPLFLETPTQLVRIVVFLLVRVSVK